MDKRKVVQLFPSKEEASKEELLKLLDQLRGMVEKGELTYFTAGGKLSDGTVATGWAGCNIVQRQEILSHMQIDIVCGCVAETYLK